MPHHDLYESLRLDRSLRCDQLVTELDNRLAALGPQGGPRVPEMQTARAVLGCPDRRALYDTQLSDPAAPPITPDDIVALSQMQVPLPRETVQDWKTSAASGVDALRDKAQAWSRDVTPAYAKDAAEAADRYGAVDSTTGRPATGRRVGALFVDTGCVLLMSLLIAVPAFIYLATNLGGMMSDALDGDVDAVWSLVRIWNLSGAAGPVVTTTSLIIAVVLVAYCIATEVYWGGSLGKKVTGCRVVTADGRHPDLAAAAKRNWWPVLFFLPAVGLLLWIVVVVALAVSILTDRRGLSFLDKWAGVAVVPAVCPSTFGRPANNIYDWSA